MPAFTYYRQFESMDCGAACLRMVARAHGKEYGLEELRERTRQGRTGTTLLGISEAAESIGLQTLALPVAPTQLRDELPLPCILPWRGDHFVVLYAVDGEGFHIADPDPDVRTVTLTESEFTINWEASEGEGVALLLEPTNDFHRAASIDRPSPRSADRYLSGYLWSYRGILWSLAAGLLLSVAIQLTLPFLVAAVVDRGIILDDPTFILLTLGGYAVLITLTVLLKAIRTYTTGYLGGRLNLSLTGDYLAKLLRLPLSFFDSRHVADVAKGIADHDLLEAQFTKLVQAIAPAVLQLSFTIVLLWWSLPVCLAFVAGNLVILLFQRGGLGTRRDYLDRLKAIRSRELSRLGEIVEGAAELKQYGSGLAKRWGWERDRAERYRTQLALRSHEQRHTGITSIVYQLTLVATSAVAAYGVLGGALSLGQFVAIQFILAQLSRPTSVLSETVTAYRKAERILERINEVHHKGAEVAGAAADRQVVQVETTPLKIRLKNVEFAYPGPGVDTVLTDVSTKIPAGKITAVVGASGSGKSTLLKLLYGFYPPQKGKLTVGDHPLAAYQQAAWRRQIALVNQESYVFTDSVLGNLTLGDDSIDQDRLRRAIEITQLGKVIDRLPRGLDTLIGRGGRGLSRGQRQRLLLARAIYRKPNYLLLDEATSGLDAYMEVTIMDELFSYLSESTIVIVAHRYATFQQASQIILLEEGRIAERGTHDDLMAERQQYYRIVHHQMLLGN